VRQVDWGEGEVLQAQYGARMYLTALGEGGIGYSYHTLSGMINDEQMNPQLLLKSIHTMDSILGDAEPLGKVDVGYDYICYLFKVGNKTVAGLWAKDAEYAQPSTLTFPPQTRVTVVNMFGTAVPKRPLPANSFALDRELAYLTFDGSTPEQVTALVREALRE